MSDLPDIVKRAAGLHGAIASDLSLFGGVLRCSKCGREQPLGDVGGHLGHGWPKCCGYTMTWVTLKQIAAEGWDVPDDCELVVFVDPDWRVESGKLCARKVHRTTCRKPSVAELNRQHTRLSPFRDGSFTSDAWWPYCLDHLYGRWIESGSVMHWVLREKGKPVA